MEMHSFDTTAPLSLGSDARQRLLKHLHALAENIANISRLAEHQDDGRLVELILQIPNEFARFLTSVLN